MTAAEIQKSFIDAVTRGDTKTARRMIAAGADVNAPIEKQSERDWVSYPILKVFGDEDDLEMLKLLVAAGADVNQRDVENCTPLMLCDPCRSDVTKFLLESGADVNVRDDEGFTPLMLAAMEGAHESVRLFLEAEAHVNVHALHDLETPYDYAEVEDEFLNNPGAPECIRLLEEAGALSGVVLDIEDAPSLSPVDYEFLQAVQYQDIGRVKRALENGADINAKDRYGMSAMVQAVDYNNAELIDLLLKEGISAENISASLEWASRTVSGNKFELITLLLSRLEGEQRRKAEERILLTASYVGRLDVVNMMLRAGVDPNCRTDEGKTPLFLAVEPPDYEMPVVLALLDAGADIHCVNKEGNSLLWHATARGYIDVVKLLLEKDADYTKKSTCGMSAYERSRRDPEVARVFDEFLKTTSAKKQRRLNPPQSH